MIYLFFIITVVRHQLTVWCTVGWSIRISYVVRMAELALEQFDAALLIGQGVQCTNTSRTVYM